MSAIGITTRAWPYGWATPYLAAIARQNPAFAARVLDISRPELHYFALILSLMEEARDDLDHLGALARAVDRVDRVAIFNMMAPGRDSGLVRLSQKFAGDPWRPRTYLRIANLYSDPEARKTLSHKSAITRRDILTLARLPDGFRGPKITALAQRKTEITELVFAIDIVRRLRADLTDRQIAASLCNAKRGKIRDWVMRHFERVEFPAAPTTALSFGGTRTIQPVTSFAALARAAQDFKNCIRNYQMNVLRGESYFYRCDCVEAGNAKPVAMIELTKAPVVGWLVHEALGPDNEPITGADRAAIVSAFRAAGVGAAPQAIHPGVWFDLG